MNSQQNKEGSWEPAIPLPYYYKLLPFIFKKLTRWRDEYNRPAHFIGFEWMQK